IDDLATSNIDQHASGFHHLEAVFVEQPGGLRCPLATNRHEIALRQKPVKRLGSADFAKALWQWRTGLRLAPCSDNPHAERGAQPTDFVADPAGPDHACGLAVD